MEEKQAIPFLVCLADTRLHRASGRPPGSFPLQAGMGNSDPPDVLGPELL